MDIHLTGLICHLFEILSKIFIKDRILSENRTIYNWNIVKCLANDGRKEKRRKKEWEKNQKKWLLQPQQWKKRLSTLSNISSLSANFLILFLSQFITIYQIQNFFCLDLDSAFFLNKWEK